MDGNGRTARFVMNSQLVTAGYPWVVIPVERREEYMAALEKSSVEGDVEGFVRFIGGLMRNDIFNPSRKFSIFAAQNNRNFKLKTSNISKQ